MFRWCIWLTHWTLICEVIRRVKRVSRIHHPVILRRKPPDHPPEDGPVVYPANACDSCLRGHQIPLGSSPTKPQKTFFWLPARNCLSLSLRLSFSPLSYFLSFSIETWELSWFFATDHFVSRPTQSPVLKQITLQCVCGRSSRSTFKRNPKNLELVINSPTQAFSFPIFQSLVLFPHKRATTGRELLARCTAAT